MLHQLKAVLSAFLGFAVLAPSPAFAGEPLWRDVEAGMTIQQVQALYPLNPGEGRKVEHHKSNTELHGFMTLGKCKPRVEILHPQGEVVGVRIWLRKQSVFEPTCFDEARLAVFAKFGPPDMDNTRRSILPNFADMARESLTWVEPNMTVEWLGGDSFQEWSIEYRAAPANSAHQL